MAAIEDIREGIAATLKAGLGSVQTHAYNLSNPTPPCLIVLGHDEVDYGNLAFGRRDAEWNLIVRGMVSTGMVDLAGQKRLDRWLASEGTDSVREVLEADKTLGGLADWILVLRATGSNVFQLSNTLTALGTDFIVQVQTSE